jgi:dipeptidase E
MMPQQIIAMGGGGFSMEPNNLALDRYVVGQTKKPRPKVCFLAQASGESYEYVSNFYRAFASLEAVPSHLSLFRPHTADLEGFLMEQDAVYVGGGNTKSMLALWREWQLDVILKRAMENGTVLAGISAGAICWFEECSTDSIAARLSVLKCLGYLKGSACPHYDGEEERRPSYQKMVATGEIMPGLALDDGAAAHFMDGELHQVVTSRPKARAYRVERVGDDEASETVLEVKYLG